MSDSVPKKLTLAKPGSGEGRLEPLFVADDAGLPKEYFMIPSHYEEDIKEVLIPHGFLLDRIEKLAFDIKQHYGDEGVDLICILKGSRGFFNHLLQNLNKSHMYGSQHSTRPPYMEHYVRLKSYVNDQSSGDLQVIAEDLSVLKNKNVLIVEDIIDTGLTLTKFCKYLEKLGPKTVGVTSLVEKRTDKNITGFKGDFVGFSIPDAFVVGFGLDYNEMFRDLDHVGVVSETGKDKYAKRKTSA
eukprot:GDKI01027330.1.p1 GENE.GDKI01027330.1~~GDKI01027330.1.p1  ORF type:complete len:242 (-),score=97.69 GDKI01027330.1:468-1193(-)